MLALLSAGYKPEYQPEITGWYSGSYPVGICQYNKLLEERQYCLHVKKCTEITGAAYLCTALRFRI